MYSKSTELEKEPGRGDASWAEGLTGCVRDRHRSLGGPCVIHKVSPVAYNVLIGPCALDSEVFEHPGSAESLPIKEGLSHFTVKERQKE